jgi:hypothetical protein
VRATASLLALLLAAALLGCGGSEDSTSTDASRPSSPGSPATETGKSADSGGGAKQFLNEGSDNSIQESGSEASRAQREEAAAALHGYLDSTARSDWGSACNYLSEGVYKQLLASFELEGRPCPEVLEGFFGGVPEKNFVEAAKADVGSFRVEDDHGFLLYHGAKGVDYQMPMVLEGEGWKVAALAGSPLL